MQNTAIIGAVIVIAVIAGIGFYLTSNPSPAITTTATTVPVSTIATTAAITSTATTTAQTTASEVTTPTTTIQPHSNNLQVPWKMAGGNYTVQNQQYCTSSNQQANGALQLDLYSNAPVNYSSIGNGLRPIAVFVHGGGLMTGDKSSVGSDSPVFATIVNYLISNGFIVASLNYNLAPSFKYPNQTDDVLCAVRFLRYYAKSFDGNPDQIAVFGDSSGGQLATAIGITNGTAPWENEEGLQIYGAQNLTALQYLSISTKPQVVDDFYGSINNTMPPGYTEQQVQQMMPQTYQNIVAVYNYNATLMYEGSPTQFVTSGEPPFLIFQGNNDTMVPSYISKDFYDNLIAHGDTATMIIVNNSDHRFVPSPSTSQLHPGLAYIANYTVSYFKKII